MNNINLEVLNSSDATQLVKSKMGLMAHDHERIMDYFQTAMRVSKANPRDIIYIYLVGYMYPTGVATLIKIGDSTHMEARPEDWPEGVPYFYEVLESFSNGNILRFEPEY